MNKRQSKKQKKKVQLLWNKFVNSYREEINKVIIDQIIFGVGKIEYIDGKLRHIPYNPFEENE